MTNFTTRFSIGLKRNNLDLNEIYIRGGLKYMFAFKLYEFIL